MSGRRARALWLDAGSTLLCLIGCGDARGRDPSPCEQLRDTLCARSVECAAGQSEGSPVRDEQLYDECRRGLAEEVVCTYYPDAPLAFEDCLVSVEQMSCSIVRSGLARQRVLAPSSCSRFLR